MLHIKRLEEGVELFKALGSEPRINILKLLLEYKEMNMNELASHLGITNGALTSHIKKMEEVGSDHHSVGTGRPWQPKAVPHWSGQNPGGDSAG